MRENFFRAIYLGLGPGIESCFGAREGPGSTICNCQSEWYLPVFLAVSQVYQIIFIVKYLFSCVYFYHWLNFNIARHNWAYARHWIFIMYSAAFGWTHHLFCNAFSLLILLTAVVRNKETQHKYSHLYALLLFTWIETVELLCTVNKVHIS